MKKSYDDKFARGKAYASSGGQTVKSFVFHTCPFRNSIPPGTNI